MSAADDAVDVLAALVLDDGRRWGEAADHVQREDARAVLDPDGEQRLHWLGRPKGYSKSTDLAGMAMAWLLAQAPDGIEAYVVASDEDQSNRLLDKARGIIARTPELRGRLVVESRRIVNPVSGARVVALPADAPGAQDLLTPLIVVDELPNWPSTKAAREMWATVFAAVPKWRGMRLVVIGHAGDPSHWSYPVLQRARVSSRWRVREVPGPTPWHDPADLEEQRALLAPSWFARRFLNVWTAAEDRLSTVDDVRACVGHVGALPPAPGVRYQLGLDLGLKNDRTVLTVGHLEDDGEGPVVVVDRQVVWQGTREVPVPVGEVEAAVLEAHRAYNRASLVVDPWQAALLVQRLRARGVRCTEWTFNQSSNGRLAATLFRLLRDHALDLPDDEGLVEELAAVELRETSPGVFRMDHSSAGHDDRAVSLALVAHSLLMAPVRGRRRVVRSSRVGERPEEVPPAGVVPVVDAVTARLVARDEAARAAGFDV